MKSFFRFTAPSSAALAIIAMLLTGCLFKSSTMPVRHFILAPIATNGPAPATTEPLSVGIGFVKMPTYLLRDSLTVRTSDNEIEKLEGALWGERLDQCFERALAANLSWLLSSGNVYSTDWDRSQLMFRVFISVQQFDVDTQGRGTLIANWRITPPDTDTPVKRGTARLERTGPASRGNPGAVATTLSELVAGFSRELAEEIRGAPKGSNK
jgi:uncharacterized lipoprotein YmbA